MGALLLLATTVPSHAGESTALPRSWWSWLLPHPVVERVPVHTPVTGRLSSVCAYKCPEQHLHVRGTVRNGFAPGRISGAWTHVDVIVLDGNGRTVDAVKTYFSPRDVPASLRGRQGRSHFAISRKVSEPGRTVRVLMHDSPRSRCSLPNSI